jgi:zinc transport system permease protein
MYYLFICFNCFVTFTVVMAVQAVGLILVIALLTIPAYIAESNASHLRNMIFISVACLGSCGERPFYCV